MKATQLGMGVFTLENYLSPSQCREYIALGERMGYEPSLVNLPGGARILTEVRNNDRVVFDDAALAELLFARARPFLPEEIQGWKLQGFNERMRFYRYGQREYFKWHKDGTFARSATQESFLTFMIYLNQGFEGGDTQFRWETVKPQEGMVLVFPHKQSHQGAEILNGTKYVLRTDVIYRNENPD